MKLNTSFVIFSGVELVSAFYGCLYVGCVPVTIRPPHPQNVASTLPTVRMIVEVSKSVAILTNSTIIKLLKTKVNQTHFADSHQPSILISKAEGRLTQRMV